MSLTGFIYKCAQQTEQHGYRGRPYAHVQADRSHELHIPAAERAPFPAGIADKKQRNRKQIRHCGTADVQVYRQMNKTHGKHRKHCGIGNGVRPVVAACAVEQQKRKEYIGNRQIKQNNSSLLQQSEFSSLQSAAIRI